MKTLITSLFGLDSKLFDRLPASIRKKYGTKLIAFIISILISNVVAIEIAMTVFEITGIIPLIFICLIYSFVIGAFDILLMRKAFPGIIRLVFSLAIISISSMSFFALLTKKDIQNNRNTESEQQVAIIDSTYQAEKKERYEVLEAKKEQQLTYHNEVCVPESKRVEAGPVYDRKHQHCLTELANITTLENELNTKEEPFKTAYDKKIEQAEKISSLGFFETMALTWEEIWSDNIKKGGFFALLIILICLESIVFFTNIRNDTTEYEEIEKIEIENQKEINKEKATNAKTAELANEKNKNEEELWTIQNEHDRRKRFLELNGKMEILKLLNHIHAEYTKTKKLQPDLMNPNVAKSIEMLISNEIAIVQKSVEDNIDDASTSYSTADTDDNYTEGDNSVDDKQLRNYYANLFYCTTPMKTLADELFQKANGEYYQYSKNVFQWAVENISYQNTHDLSHYKTARESYISKTAICGEMSIFINAMLKYKGFKPSYIHVDIDTYGEAVNHAASGIDVNGRTIIIDVAYKSFDISHQRWNKVSDEELIKNMIAWNK